MAAKMLAATQNINANKQNRLKIAKKTLISNLCYSCVRLLVHRFTFSMLYKTRKDMALSAISMNLALADKEFVLSLHHKLHVSTYINGPRSAVGNVPGYRCVSDCRSRGRQFDPGPVPYFRGD